MRRYGLGSRRRGGGSDDAFPPRKSLPPQERSRYPRVLKAEAYGNSAPRQTPEARAAAAEDAFAPLRPLASR